MPLQDAAAPGTPVGPGAPAGPAINNAWYADLGARWYAADDTPIALLRAESHIVHRGGLTAVVRTQVLGIEERLVLDLVSQHVALAGDRR